MTEDDTPTRETTGNTDSDDVRKPLKIQAKMPGRITKPLLCRLSYVGVSKSARTIANRPGPRKRFGDGVVIGQSLRGRLARRAAGVVAG